MSPARAGAALLAIGDELLEGRYADSNSAEIARALLAQGIEVNSIDVVGDDEQQLAALLQRRMRESRLVLSTGGLGPTLDDLTREAAARALGVALVSDAQAQAQLRARFAQRGLSMPEINLRQAQLPAGASLLHNAWGTAPGFVAEHKGALLVCLPGPPTEMRGMLSEHLSLVLSRVRGRRPALAHAQLHLIGLSESAFAELVGARMERGRNPRLGVTASDGRLTAALVARGATHAEARALLEAERADLRSLLARWIYSEDEPRIECVLARELLSRGLRVATAESCSGGWLAGALCSVPGISAVFREGWVCYDERAKVERLGVAPELIAAHGLVSPQVAAAMASAAARLADADLGISITGLAGPGGGSPEQPVGSVCIGVHVAAPAASESAKLPAVPRVSPASGTPVGRASALAFRAPRVRTLERCFPPGDRDRIRRMAVASALAFAWGELRD
jgi:nicotinamide-nucleotide amidase